MAWVRVHDAALTHPKLTGLVSLAHPFTLWIWGLTYCQMHLTDGRIPKGALGGGSKRAAQELIARGLWAFVDDEYRVHDYLDWNDSRETITKKRSEAKTRMQASRERRSEERSSDVFARTSISRTSYEVLRGVGKSSKDPNTKNLERESEGKPESIELRGGHLVEKYGELYVKHRFGAKHQQRPNLDWHDAMRLCEVWDDARLEKLAVLVLTTDDPWISKTDRSFKIFAMKATWADDRLKVWEMEHQVTA